MFDLWPTSTTIPEIEDTEEDDLEIPVEEKIEPYQKPPIESWNQIISTEEFFTDDLPISSHSLEESPCFPIIDIRCDKTKTEIKYYCILHQDFESNFKETIENHCRQTEPERHKAAILEKGKF